MHRAMRRPMTMTDLRTSSRSHAVALVALLLTACQPDESSAPTQGESPEALGEASQAVCSSWCTSSPSRTIIGCDDRVVKDPEIDGDSAQPWSFSGRFDGSSKCSGTLIGSKFVLTAGHCMLGKANTTMGFALGQEVQAFSGRPYGTNGVRRVFVPTAFVANDNEADAAFDYAVAELWSPIAGATPAEWGYVPLQTLTSLNARSVGYPTVQPDGGFLGRPWSVGSKLYAASQPFAYLDGGESGLLYTNIDGWGGQSGSGVYSFVDGVRTVTGVLIGSPVDACSDGEMWVSRLTPGAVEHIENLMTPNVLDFFWTKSDLNWSATVDEGETWP